MGCLIGLAILIFVLAALGFCGPEAAQHANDLINY